MNCLQKKIVFLCLFAGLMFAASGLSAQNPSDAKRFNLAVYATGTKDDNELDKSLLTIIQNRAITKLTSGSSEYQLIERSNDFLKQIQSEQKMQSSGEVADGQIAEIGAGFGAEKICVVSITVIQKYLYIATRIVDVATKTSFESGDAEEKLYLSIPQLTKTLDNSLDKMMNTKPRSKASSNSVPSPQPPQNEPPTKVINSTQPTSTEQIAPVIPSQTVTSQIPDKNPSNQNTYQTVAEAKAQVEREKTEAKAETKQAKRDFNAYKKQVIKEKGGFLGVNSLAYKEYQKYHKSKVTGSVLMTVGPLVGAGAGVALLFGLGGDWGELFGYSCNAIGGCLFIAGVAVLCAAPSHLKKSYGYYINGEQHTASFNVHPYFDRNNTFGAGITLQF